MNNDTFDCGPGIDSSSMVPGRGGPKEVTLYNTARLMGPIIMLAGQLFIATTVGLSACPISKGDC